MCRLLGLLEDSFATVWTPILGLGNLGFGRGLGLTTWTFVGFVIAVAIAFVLASSIDSKGSTRSAYVTACIVRRTGYRRRHQHPARTRKQVLRTQREERTEENLGSSSHVCVAPALSGYVAGVNVVAAGRAGRIGVVSCFSVLEGD